MSSKYCSVVVVVKYIILQCYATLQCCSVITIVARVQWFGSSDRHTVKKCEGILTIEKE